MPATIMTKFKKGDVVQINPDEEANGGVRGCIGIVTGGYQSAPDDNTYATCMIVAPHGELHVFLFRDEDVDYVGKARYMPETEWMPVVE